MSEEQFRESAQRLIKELQEELARVKLNFAQAENTIKYQKKKYLEMQEERDHAISLAEMAKVSIRVDLGGPE